MRLQDYRETILLLAEANEVTEDVGRDMFIANLEASARGEEAPYKGAEDFDYTSVCDNWTSLSLDERNAACVAYMEYADVVDAIGE